MKHPRNGCVVEGKQALFNTSTGLSANQVVVTTDDIIEAVKKAIAVRYGTWQEAFWREIVFKKADFTTINEAIRALAVDAMSEAGQDEVALIVADHGREGPIPHHEVRAAADYAIAELKLLAGLTYAQREQIPPKFRGFAEEVEPGVLVEEQ